MKCRSKNSKDTVMESCLKSSSIALDSRERDWSIWEDLKGILEKTLWENKSWGYIYSEVGRYWQIYIYQFCLFSSAESDSKGENMWPQMSR